jgi:hypothetical protein
MFLDLCSPTVQAKRLDTSDPCSLTVRTGVLSINTALYVNSEQHFKIICVHPMEFFSAVVFATKCFSLQVHLRYNFFQIF